MQSLAEQYRPQTLDDVVGNRKAVQALGRLIRRGLGGQALWISGPSGTGKTTLARIAARSIADDFWVEEFDSADDVNQAALDDIRRAMHLMAGGLGGRVWIVNEAHGLRRAIVRQLLGVLERLPAHCLVIFTTTHDGQEALFDDQIDAGPLLSRCLPVRLTNQGLAPLFARRAKEIAAAEGLDGACDKMYLALVQRCRNNMRAVLQAVQSGELGLPAHA